MSRNREPIDLIRAKGLKHLSEREYEERKAQELQVPYTDVHPPAFLTTKKQQGLFTFYADRLLGIGVMTELDVDCLGRYIIAMELYENYAKQLRKIAAKANTVRKWAVIDQLATLCDADDGTIEDLKNLLEQLVRRQRGDDQATIMSLMDKAFKQAQSAAREMGLTITSRAKLVVPPPPDEDDEL